MEFLLSWRRLLYFMSLLAMMNTSVDCYDPLDPNGNITVTFDIKEWRQDGYVAKVRIQNYYQYRHVEKPGWQLGWSWTHEEIIWSMTGAVAIKQGNCSNFKFQSPPHSCQPNPVVEDLWPDAAPEMQSENCCRNGLLAASAIDPLKSSSSFEMVVGNLGANSTGYLPENLTFIAPGAGYTCSLLEDFPPTITPAVNGRREEQAFRTWKSSCTYSSFRANKEPICCVSLSTFYNPTITECPKCSCGCRPTASNDPIRTCVGEGYAAQFAAAGDVDMNQLVGCTDHMCPVRVHWHIKSNYREHWRVKMTVSNYNYGISYSGWNLVVQHPGFSQQTWAFSFNTSKLNSLLSYGKRLEEEAALFWGREYYNSELLHAEEKELGSVTTEILLRKDLESFTFQNGWAFPRKIYFNGEDCEMPLPQDFPGLPNLATDHSNHRLLSTVTLVFLISLAFQLLV